MCKFGINAQRRCTILGLTLIVMSIIIIIVMFNTIAHGGNFELASASGSKQRLSFIRMRIDF